MKKENLNRGNEIVSQLKGLNSQKEAFEKLQEDKQIYSEINIHGGNSNVLKTKYIDIDVMCCLALQKINKEIKELEDEFENL